MNKLDNNARSERNDSIRLVITTLLVISLFLSAVGASWSWFKPLMGNHDVEDVTVETANLSIVYNSGPQYSVNNVLPGWSGTKTFTVTNNGEREATYNISWQNITNLFNGKNDIVYSITSTNGGGSLSETPFPSTGTNLPIISNITIPANTTQTYTVTMRFINRASEQNDQGSKLSGKIIINEAAAINLNRTLAYKLMDNNPPANNPTTTPGRQISTTDEGLIKGPADDYGSPTYYFRGNVQDNYVSFAGLTWRVVKINGDGSIRLILNDTTGSNVDWNTEIDPDRNSDSYTDTLSTALRWLTYGNSPVKTTVDSWYNTNIGNNSTYDRMVETGKFCNDRKYTSSGVGAYFDNNYRITSSTPVKFTCYYTSHIYNEKAGILTADEVAFAGMKYQENNNNNYLFINRESWTMTPMTWANGNQIVTIFTVDDSIRWTSVGGRKYARPVINLNKYVTATLDSDTNPGTSSNPYRIS